jgi:hypothetical protein
LIARELHGMGEMSFYPSGMHCVIEIPLAPHPDE